MDFNKYYFEKMYLRHNYIAFCDIYERIYESNFDLYESVPNHPIVKTKHVKYKRSYLIVDYSRTFNGKEWVWESISYIKLIFPNLEKLFCALDNSIYRYYMEHIFISSPKFPSGNGHAVLLLFDNEYKTISLIDPNNEWGFVPEINTLFKNLFSESWYTFLPSNDLLKKPLNIHKPGYCLDYSILFSELFLRSNEDPDMILQEVKSLSDDSRYSYICNYKSKLYETYKEWIKN
jgi:hypothetical protein